MLAAVRANGRGDPAFGDRGRLAFKPPQSGGVAVTWHETVDGRFVGLGRSQGGYYLVKLGRDGRRDGEFGDGGVARGRLG